MERWIWRDQHLRSLCPVKKNSKHNLRLAYCSNFLKIEELFLVWTPKISGKGKGRWEGRRGSVTLRYVIRRRCDMWHVRAQSLPVRKKKEKKRKRKLTAVSPSASYLFLRLTLDIFFQRRGRNSLLAVSFQNWKRNAAIFYSREETFPRNERRIVTGRTERLKSCFMRSNLLQARHNEGSISPRVFRKAGKWRRDFSAPPLFPAPFLSASVSLNSRVRASLISFWVAIDISFFN